MSRLEELKKVVEEKTEVVENIDTKETKEN
jgi:hypothetical protein